MDGSSFSLLEENVSPVGAHFKIEGIVFYVDFPGSCVFAEQVCPGSIFWEVDRYGLGFVREVHYNDELLKLLCLAVSPSAEYDYLLFCVHSEAFGVEACLPFFPGLWGEVS